MREMIKQIVAQLQNPDTASSFMPLLVVISIFILVAAGMLFLILRMLRAPKGPEATEGTTAPYSNDESEALVVLNPAEKLRNFLRWSKVRTGAQGESALLAELEILRAKVEKLERENANLRAMHAKSLNKATELAEQMAMLKDKQDSDLAAFTAASEQRDKLQAKVSQMESELKEAAQDLEDLYKENASALEKAEGQKEKAQKRTQEIEIHLRDFIAELETLYRANAPVTEVSKLGGRFTSFFNEETGANVTTSVGLSHVPSNSEVARLTEELAKQEFFVVTQREEIKKLKNVLKIAKEQIMALTAKQKASNSSPTPTEQKAA